MQGSGGESPSRSEGNEERGVGGGALDAAAILQHFSKNTRF